MGASAMLGDDHPLTRAESQERLLRAQFAVTVVFGVLAAMLAPLLGRAALRLSLGAAVVAGVIALAAFAAHLRLRDRAFELIASGQEDLPLPAVECERSRLSNRRYRRRIAHTLDSIRLQPEARDWWSAISADQAAVSASEHELREIARLLRELPTVRARGVALVTSLIRDGATSPLYQGPALRLREELGRIRHVLVQT
ncbi:MAG: hypothetical protein QOK36_103 [Gaiellales bacterium]|jgi:hypothetical protein|nr:hypothetical protein [Gaiellales bacterium]